MHQLDELISLLEHVLVPRLGDAAHRSAKLKQGQYYYIPFSPHQFVEEMFVIQKLTAEKPNRLKFIDVGCGVGTKLALASYIFQKYDIYGIEISREYVNAANRLQKAPLGQARYNSPHPPMFTVVHGDAIKHSYSKYDIIYFYCPLANPKLERKLEERILKTARKGTIICGHLTQSDREVWDKYCKPLPNKENVDLYQVL